jgi:transcriptional regulator with XRE-family HTH domain
MTPADLRRARKALGLSQKGLAEALRLSEKNGGRSVRNWERDGNTVPGPVQVAVEFLLAERRTMGESANSADKTANPGLTHG